MALQMMLPGARLGGNLDRRYAKRIEAAVASGVKHITLRKDPREGEAKSDIGMVREILDNVDPYEKLKLERSPLTEGFVRLLCAGPLAQMTVHVGDISTEDVKSFTFFVTKKMLTSSRLKRGDIAVFYVRAVLLGHAGAVWVADILQHPL